MAIIKTLCLLEQSGTKLKLGYQEKTVILQINRLPFVQLEVQQEICIFNFIQTDNQPASQMRVESQGSSDGVSNMEMGRGMVESEGW